MEQFDDLKAKFRPDLEALLRKRNTLEPHEVLDAKTPWDNIYFSIKKVNKSHGDSYKNMVFEDDHKNRMAALRIGVVNKILQNDELSREIVKALYGTGSSKPVMGMDFSKDYFSFIEDYKSESILFTKTPHKNVVDTLKLLMGSGLLDFTVYSENESLPNNLISYPAIWCFESETVTLKRDNEVHDLLFFKNNLLRDNLKKALEPYKSENHPFIYTRDVKDYKIKK